MLAPFFDELKAQGVRKLCHNECLSCLDRLLVSYIWLSDLKWAPFLLSPLLGDETASFWRQYGTFVGSVCETLGKQPWWHFRPVSLSLRLSPKLVFTGGSTCIPISDWKSQACLLVTSIWQFIRRSWPFTVQNTGSFIVRDVTWP